MGPRQEAMPGYSLHLRAARATERDRHVNRGQAGADQQHGLVGERLLDRTGAPGVGHIPLRRGQGRIDAGQFGGPAVAKGEHDPVGPDFPAVVEFQGDEAARLARVDADRLGPDPLEGYAGRFADRAVEQVDQVAAEDPAGEVLLGLRLGRFPADPFEEVVGPVRKADHLTGRHVQPVLLVLGAVRDARSYPLRLLDQHDPQPGSRTSEQLDRGQGAGSATADDGDRRHRFRRRLTCHFRRCSTGGDVDQRHLAGQMPDQQRGAAAIEEQRPVATRLGILHRLHPADQQSVIAGRHRVLESTFEPAGPALPELDREAGRLGDLGDRGTGIDADREQGRLTR